MELGLEWWQIAVLTLMGFISGWINVLAGGGSILTVPVMVFMGIPAPVANGTNRMGILAQNLTAVATFHRGGLSDYKLSATLSLAAALGAIGGAQVGVEFEGPWFNRVVAIIMLAVLLLMLTGQDRVVAAEGDSGRPRRVVLGHLLMVGAGFWGGFIQIGVGFILMPILHRVMGLDLVRVNMHKVFIVLVFSVIALAIFAAQVQLLWIAGLGLAAGSALGGWLGARTNLVHGERWIRPVLYATMLAFIVKLLWT